MATATAWADEAPAVGRQAILHWVSVVPGQQGLGLGKAVVQRALQIFSELEPGADIYLHTQTWSHRAVKLYEKFGFYITKEPNLFKYANNQYEEATALLAEIYSRYPAR